MANFKSFLFPIIFLMFLGCSSTGSMIEEVDENLLLGEINCFVRHIQELWDNKVQVFNVSKYGYKNNTYFFIKTDTFYSDVMVNNYYREEQFYNTPHKSTLDGCIVNEHEMICFYNFSEIKNLIKKRELFLKYKENYTTEERQELGGYTLDALYSVKKGKLKIESITAIGGAFYLYIEDREKLCNLLPVKLSKELRKSIRYLDRLERKGW